jgi:hypothetical protein
MLTNRLPESIATERLVPVYLSPDSAMLFALLECDSNKQVVLKEYRELKSRNLQSDISLSNGKMEYKVKTLRDTVYIPAKDSIIYQPVLVSGQVNDLTPWQKTRLRIANFVLILIPLIGFIYFKLKK